MKSIEMGGSVARPVVAALMATLVAVWLASAPSLAQDVASDGQGADRQRADVASTPVVIELFTSQGCSSCPPADALLNELAKRDDVIALALHVDYWDYIGWADNFARPEHTVRQKGYARAAGDQMIYTPQMIIDGAVRVAGAKAMAVVAAIESHRGAVTPVGLRLARAGETLSVEVIPLRALDREMVVQLVRYRAQGEVDILRGENAGKTLNYVNIVTAWDVVAEWDGAAPLSLDLDAPGDEPAVVIIQEADHGVILAAARAD